MTGSCNFARPPRKAVYYARRFVAQGPPQARIRVRARAVFRGPDNSNVIGTIAPGSVVYGAGPVKDSEASPGIGYAVLVRDPDGRVCHGYIHRRFLRPKP